MVRPPVPTITFPDHHRPVIGLCPDRYGIVSGMMEDSYGPGVLPVTGNAGSSHVPCGGTGWVAPGQDRGRGRYDAAITRRGRVQTMRAGHAGRTPWPATLHFDVVQKRSSDRGLDSPARQAAIGKVDAAQIQAGLAQGRCR